MLVRFATLELGPRLELVELEFGARVLDACDGELVCGHRGIRAPPALENLATQGIEAPSPVVRRRRIGRRVEDVLGLVELIECERDACSEPRVRRASFGDRCKIVRCDQPRCGAEILGFLSAMSTRYSVASWRRD